MKLTNIIFSNKTPSLTRILVLLGVAWLPLMLLTIIDGTFYTPELTIPFINDVSLMVRVLIVIPLLVLADNLIEPMMARVLAYFKSSGVIAASEKACLNSAADRMMSQMNSRLVQVILLLIVVGISWLLHADYVDMWKNNETTSWMLYIVSGEVDETLAGAWYLLVTSPLVLFLLYRWVWRFIIWSIFLYRVSRMKLELRHSHTDLSGGIGLLGGNHAYFSIIFFIMASLLSSDIASNVLYEGDTLADLKQVMVVFITISMVLLLIPLLFFTNKLIHLKHEGLSRYGALQNQISGDFHEHWIKEEAKDLVDSMQPSAMADYSAVYEIIREIRVVPISPKTVAFVAVLLLLPFLPLTLTETSFWEILGDIGDSLL
jgi:hypothetical protein